MRHETWRDMETRDRAKMKHTSVETEAKKRNKHHVSRQSRESTRVSKLHHWFSLLPSTQCHCSDDVYTGMERRHCKHCNIYAICQLVFSVYSLYVWLFKLVNNYYRFTAIIQDNLRKPASPAKNWRILLEQSSTTRMRLLMAISAFGLGEDARIFHNGVTCTVPRLHTVFKTRHRASTSMYSLTFCVRVMSPERHHWKSAVQAAAVMLRTPPSPACH